MIIDFIALNRNKYVNKIRETLNTKKKTSWIWVFLKKLSFRFKRDRLAIESKSNAYEKTLQRRLRIFRSFNRFLMIKKPI